MSIVFIRADVADAEILNDISAAAFESDIEVGASQAGGPPGYNSLSFHTDMA